MSESVSFFLKQRKIDVPANNFALCISHHITAIIPPMMSETNANAQRLLGIELR